MPTYVGKRCTTAQAEGADADLGRKTASPPPSGVAKADLGRKTRVMRPERRAAVRGVRQVLLRRLGAMASTAELLTLHAVRLKGVADDCEVAARFGLEPETTTELLLDFEAYGWITRVEFGETKGWALTERGKQQGERLLAAELDQVGARPEVTGVHEEFLPWNACLQKACTDWQLRPTGTDPLAVNQHDDPDWDERALAALVRLDEALRPLTARLTERLARLEGYDTRFSAALARVRAGDPSWVTKVGADSCHTVWMELHEDLLATLGLER